MSHLNLPVDLTVMKHLIVLIIALLLTGLSPALGYATPPPLLLGDAQSYSLAGHLEQLDDPGGKLTLADVLTPTMSSRFKPISGYMNRGYTRDAVWLRFKMERTALFPEQAYLCLGPPFLDTVAVYFQTAAPTTPASYELIAVGDHVPRSRQLIKATDCESPFNLARGQSATIYLRVRSTRTVTLAGDVHTLPALINHNNLSILLNGGFLAIALVVILINLNYYVRLRDRLNLYFAIVTFGQLCYRVGSVGMYPLLLPYLPHLEADYLVGGGGGIMLSFSTLFALHLFNLPRGTWTHRFLTGMVFMGILLALSVPFDCFGVVAQCAIFGAIVTMMLFSRMSITMVSRSEPDGRLYLVAFCFACIGYTAQFLRVLGVMPIHWWNTHILPIVSLCNMLLMTQALMNRLHTAEEQALAAARGAEQKAVELAAEMTVELRVKQDALEDALDREQQVNKEKTRFLSMLSHEYRTPLTIIQANLDLLALRGSEEGRTPEPRFVTMQHAVKRLVEIMEISLKKERQEHRGDRSVTERIELLPFLDAIIDEAERFWPARVFVFIPPTASMLLAGDVGLLKTALLNLLDNACKYSPVESYVTLECHADGGVAVITVLDQGNGILPGEVDILFEKYRRGGASTGTTGAGVGLWLVRQIIEQHGGSISFAPAPEQGTQAILRLPMAMR